MENRNQPTHAPLTANSFLIIIPGMLITLFCMFAHSVSTRWSLGATRWSRRMSPSWSRSRCWARGAWSSLSPTSRPQSASQPRYEPEEIDCVLKQFVSQQQKSWLISDEFWWKKSSKEAFQLWKNMIRKWFRGGKIKIGGCDCCSSRVWVIRSSVCVNSLQLRTLRTLSTQTEQFSSGEEKLYDHHHFINKTHFSHCTGVTKRTQQFIF